MIHIRRAGSLDAVAMADLLNAIIAKGGTTAHTKPRTRQDMIDAMTACPDRSCWLVAEDDAGEILGFQLIEPYPPLPPEACDVGTFTKLGLTQSGIGSALFAETIKAARALGFEWINATIRADNSGGLAYYQSRGFEDYARHADVALEDGSIVDKISKRYTL
ncbi:MAG: N-acetyltransferase family protein [Roseovarius sp.]